MAKEKVLGTCALCLASNAELQRSHIVPEFKYKGCYDSHPRRINVLSSHEPEKGKKQRPVQKGIRERLLCASCENHLSPWEGHAEKVLTGLNIAEKAEARGRGVIAETDYRQFRLFALSLLWKMGVSKEDMFSDVRLGPYQEKLRIAILEGDPLTPERYPFLVVALTVDGKFEHGWITSPFASKLDNQQNYHFVAGGFLYNFVVSNRPPPGNAMELMMPASGRLPLPIIPLPEVPHLNQFVRQQLEIHNGLRKPSPRRTM